MITLLAPLWLALAIPVAALAAWGAFARARPRRRVSAVWLWRSPPGIPAAPGRRIDPLWLLVALAALAAAVALTRPRWLAGSPAAPPLTPRWQVRSIGPAAPELWLQLPDAPPLILSIDDRPQPLPLDPHALAAGIAIRLPPGKSQYHLRLNVPGSPRPLAAALFRRPTHAPFRLLTLGPVDPALQRVFTLQPGAVPPASDAPDSVLLVADPGPTDPHAALVVAQPPALLTGITPDPAAALPAPPEGWHVDPVDVPAFVDPSQVRVHRMVRVRLAADWQIALRVNGAPWVAFRRSGDPTRPQTDVWLASRPQIDSDWAADPSFVLFFSSLLDRAVPPASAGPNRGTDWPRTDELVPAAAAPHNIPLAPSLALLTAGLSVAAMIAFAWRAR